MNKGEVPLRAKKKNDETTCELKPEAHETDV